MNLLTRSLSGVTRQKRKKAQEPVKKPTGAKGKRKRQPVQDQDSMEVDDELSQSTTSRDLSLSESEQSHIHHLTLDAVKVTYFYIFGSYVFKKLSVLCKYMLKGYTY